MQHFRNNWLPHGFGDDLLPDHPSAPYRFIFPDIFPTTPPLAAGAIQSLDIHRQYGKLLVALSGGVDSQIMLHCIKESGVEFEVFVLEFSDNRNVHDVQFAYMVCERYGITPTIIRLDIMQFLKTGRSYLYAKKYHNNSPQMAAQYWFYEQIAKLSNGVICVAGNAPQLLQHDNGSIEMLGLQTASLMGYERFAAKSGIPVIGTFLAYTPDLAYGIARHTPIATDQDGYVYGCKLAGYERCGFRFVGQWHKLNGYEMIKLALAEETGVPDYFEQQFRYPLMSDIPYSNLVEAVYSKELLEFLKPSRL